MGQQEKKASFSDIVVHKYDWLVGKKGTMVVIVDFWYEESQKYRVGILEVGKSTTIEPWPLYTDLQNEIFEGNLKFFIK